MALKAAADILDTHPGRIVIESDFHAKDAVKAVPGARWDTSSRVWTVPLAWTSCLALRAEFGEGLTIGPALKAWAAAIAPTKKVLSENRATMELPSPLPELPAFEPLFAHQRVDAFLLATAKRYMIGNETGTGKTRSALAGMSLAKHNGAEVFPMLVVAPNSTLIGWTREIEPFFPGADIRLCTGTPTKMRDALAPGGDIYVIGWDSLRRYSRLASYGSVKLLDPEKVDKEIQDIGFRSAIVDEIHRAKNPKSKRTRAAWYATSTCDLVVGMTGTPMQDTPEDMYGPLHLIFPDDYPTKSSYVDRYLEQDWDMWGGREIIGLHPNRKVEFLANFDASFRRVTKEMALPFLPPKMNEIRWVDLPTKHRKAYNSMRDRMIAEMADGSTMVAENALVKAGRLIQLANAMGEMDEDGKFHMTDASPKVDDFVTDVLDGDFEGQQVVVFTDSTELLAQLQDSMSKKDIEYVTISGDESGDERQAAMDRFQAGEIQFCLLTRAGGEGITLTAASVMVRLFRSWSYIVHTQVEDRVHRIGSEIHESVLYIDYITLDTLEEGQLVRLNAKEKRSQEVLRDDELLAMISGVPA